MNSLPPIVAWVEGDIGRVRQEKKEVNDQRSQRKRDHAVARERKKEEDQDHVVH